MNNAGLKSRLEEFRAIHVALSSKAKLEVPSKSFTDKVMHNLDRLPIRNALSPRNGLLLLCGIIVAVGITALLLSVGTFDNLNETISLENTINLDKLPLKKELVIKNPLPSIPFSGKWMVNGILVLTLGLAFVLLDRTILKPYFERRSRMQF